jgi:hypothetical protein
MSYLITAPDEVGYCNECFIVLCDPADPCNKEKFSTAFTESYGEWVENYLKQNAISKGYSGRGK